MRSRLGDHSVEINEIERDEWARSLELFADANINQSWGYGAAKWGDDRLDHIVLRRDGTVVAMAQVARMRIPLLRTAIAYVTWGPVWRRPDVGRTESSCRLMLEALKDEYVRRRGDLLRIKPYAFEGRDDDVQRLLAQAGFWPTDGLMRDAKRTILIDLGPPPEDLRRRLNKKWRNSLTNSEKESLQIREDFTALPLSRIRPLYDALLKKKNITGWDFDELARIQDQLEPREKMRITTCESEGQVIAASICSAMGDTVVGLVGVTGDEGRTKRAYYLLQWEEILWARSTGRARYDLSGINPAANPSVYHFKSGLNGEEVTFLRVYDCCLRRGVGRFVNVLERALTAGPLRRWAEAYRTRRRNPGRRALTP